VMERIARPREAGARPNLINVLIGECANVLTAYSEIEE
jgi:hypothetical protein